MWGSDQLVIHKYISLPSLFTDVRIESNDPAPTAWFFSGPAGGDDKSERTLVRVFSGRVLENGCDWELGLGIFCQPIFSLCLCLMRLSKWIAKEIRDSGLSDSSLVASLSITSSLNPGMKTSCSATSVHHLSAANILNSITKAATDCDPWWRAKRRGLSGYLDHLSAELRDAGGKYP